MGAATVQAAAGAGAMVTAASRTGAGAPDTASDVLKLDASDPASFVTALAPLDPFDHLVVAISANSRGAGIDSTEPVEAQAAFGRYWACYNALHYAKRFVRRTGSVVLVSGSSGRRPVKGYGLWTALHGAIESLAKAAAIDLAPLRVNVVSPGGSK